MFLVQYRVPILFADEVGSHVMEKIFYVASGDLYETIFANCFKKNMLQLSLHPLANYIVQHMLSNIPTAEMVGFHTIFVLLPVECFILIYLFCSIFHVQLQIVPSTPQYFFID